MGELFLYWNSMTPPLKNPFAVALGSLGGKAGTGKSKARTTEQASKAAKKRWLNYRSEMRKNKTK